MELSLHKYCLIEDTFNVYLLDKNYDEKTDKSSNPIPLEILIKQWEDLKMDFHNKLDVQIEKDSTRLKAEALLYDMKYKQVQIGCDILEVEYNEMVANSLKSLGYSIQYSSNKEDYLKSINKARKRSKSILAQSVSAVNHYKDLSEKTKKNIDSEIDNSDSGNTWLKVLVQLGITNNVHYKAHEINCWEFIEIYKRALKDKDK